MPDYCKYSNSLPNLLVQSGDSWFNCGSTTLRSTDVLDLRGIEHVFAFFDMFLVFSEKNSRKKNTWSIMHGRDNPLSWKTQEKPFLRQNNICELGECVFLEFADHR